MSRTSRTLALATALVLAALPACGGDEAKKPVAGGGAPKTNAAPAASNDEGGGAPAAGGAYDKTKGTATLKGVVRYLGVMPKQGTHVMGSEPTCASHGAVVVEKIEVNADNTLPHAFVYVGSGPSLGMSGYPAAGVQVDQKGCTYIPHVFGVVTGQSVTFKNADSVSHNVHVKGKKQEKNISQSAGQSDVYKPQKEMAVKVSCDVHSWMSSYMFVMDHPFGAASAQKTGAYEIAGLYPGKHKIKLWHENWAKDKQLEVEIDLKAGENVHDFEVQGETK